MRRRFAFFRPLPSSELWFSDRLLISPLPSQNNATSPPPTNLQVFCNGEEVMTVGGTQAEYVVDIWSGNHPFFLGKSSSIMTNAGQVSRFADKFGDLGELSEVETIDGVQAAKGTEKK